MIRVPGWFLHIVQKVFEAWEGSETWSGQFAGEAFGLPGVGRRRFVLNPPRSLG